MSTHMRLKRNIKSAARQARRANKKHSSERERAYAAHRVPANVLFAFFRSH